MSFILGFGSKPSNAVPQFSGLQVQTASNTLGLALVYGSNKVAPNIIWYGDFTATAQSQSVGGKGGVGTVTGYSYSASVVMALSEGPIAGIGTVWIDKTVSSLSDQGLSLFTGSQSQAPWGYLSSAYPTQALAYRGTAYVAAANYALDQSASLGNHSFEVKGILQGSLADYGNAQDADPALMIADFLTNPQYGVGFPDANIDYTSLQGLSGASYQAYCIAQGLVLSPALTTQETAQTILARWLKLTNATCVWSGDTLKFIPFADAAVTGAGVTFTPDVTPLYDLGDDDFILTGSNDPVELSRADPADAFNVVRLEILDRENGYNGATVEARDEAQIAAFGLRTAATTTAHEIVSLDVAALSAQLQLQRGLYIRNQYKFTLSWAYCLLEPMDVVTITDAALGLQNLPVRLVSVEETQAGLLAVVAEDFPAGAGQATLYPKQGAAGTVINQGVAAGPINPPVIFEPPPGLASSPQVWAGVSGGNGTAVDPNWGGATVWLSSDDATYTKVAEVTSPARQGALTATLSAYSGANPDATNSLNVDLSMSGGTLMSATPADARAGATLCYVGGELLAYTTATLTGPNQYALSGLYRGLYGTAASSHGAGAAFLRLDDAILKYPLPTAYVAVPIYLKFPSFNLWGRGAQTLAEALAYGYTPLGDGTSIYGNALLAALATGGSADLGSLGGAQTGAADLGALGGLNTGTIDLGALP